MKHKIDIKKIIKNNPMIKEDKFNEEREYIKQRSGLVKPTKYDILPPFSTRRRITTSP